MGGRAGAITRALVLAIAGAIAWGVLLAWCFHAPIGRGVLLGLYSWGPAIVCSARWRDVHDDTPVDAFGP